MGQGLQPRVSVVTPFYNTAQYLADAVESVLAQSYENFEYLLVNNQSTDGSAEVAQRYAERDSRIRLIRNETFVGQTENYNGALRQIGADSKYVKMVQADDAIFPDCLRNLVAVAEQDSRIGLVSSYYLNGNEPSGKGIPYGCSHMPGREALRLMLTSECFVLGTPSVVLYRADVVRSRPAFFPLGHLNPDTGAGYEILTEHDLGFSHQIESFCRAQDESITSKRAGFNPALLDYLITLEHHGRNLLGAEEFRKISQRKWDHYYRFLATSALTEWDPEFWAFHRRGLSTIGRTLSFSEVIPNVFRGFGHLASEPRVTFRRAMTRLVGGRREPPFS
ncbi:MAG TPA: glycosyltransferase family 2 protein [Polyangiaceae bacterium]|nr:glycosyltransferase family 2 protein [Polyangiaceae bacterium]